MSDWIKAEVAKIKVFDEGKRQQVERGKAIESQSYALFEELRAAITRDVAEISQTPELVARAGQLNLDLANVSMIRVERPRYPAVYLTVIKQERDFGIQRTIIEMGREDRPKRETEQLAIELGAEGAAFLKNAAGEALSIEAASGYLLKPLLGLQETDAPFDGGFL